MIRKVNKNNKTSHVEQTRQSDQAKSSELAAQHLSKNLQTSLESVDRMLSGTSRPNVDFADVLAKKIAELRKSGNASPELLKTLEQIQSAFNKFEDVESISHAYEIVFVNQVVPFLKKLIENLVLNKETEGKADKGPVGPEEYGLDLSAKDKLQLIEILKNLPFQKSNGNLIKWYVPKNVVEFLTAQAAFEKVAATDPKLRDVLEIFNSRSDTMQAKIDALGNAVFDAYMTSVNAKDETACDALKDLVATMGLQISKVPLRKLEEILRTVFKEILKKSGYQAVKGFITNVRSMIEKYLSDPPVSNANIDKAITEITKFFKSRWKQLGPKQQKDMVEWFGGDENKPSALIDILNTWRTLNTPGGSAPSGHKPFDYKGELEKAIAKAKSEGKSSNVIDALNKVLDQVETRYDKHDGKIDISFLKKKIWPLIRNVANKLISKSDKSLSAQDRVDIMETLSSIDVIGGRGIPIDFHPGRDAISILKLQVFIEGKSGGIIDKLGELCNKSAGSFDQTLDQFAKGLLNIYTGLSKGEKSGEIGLILKEVAAPLADTRFFPIILDRALEAVNKANLPNAIGTDIRNVLRGFFQQSKKKGDGFSYIIATFKSDVIDGTIKQMLERVLKKGSGRYMRKNITPLAINITVIFETCMDLLY